MNETETEPMTETPPPHERRYVYTETETLRDTATGSEYPLRQEEGAPPLVFIDGRWESSFDVIFRGTGRKLRAGSHAVPVRDAEGVRDYGAHDPYADDIEIVTAGTLHKEAKESRITLSTARAIKRAYYNNGLSMKRIAVSSGVSLALVSDVIHARVCWYA